MAKNEGGPGPGKTKNDGKRDLIAAAARKTARAEEKREAAQREKKGPAWYVEQNANKVNDLDMLRAGNTGVYAFPGGDQPSVTLEQSYHSSGNRRELQLFYRSVHDGHPLSDVKGLRPNTFVKSKWLGNAEFTSTADNPSVKKTQDALIAYLLGLAGGPFEVANATQVVDAEKKEDKKGESPLVIRQFALENEVEENGYKKGQLKVVSPKGEVTISLMRSPKYKGTDWGFTPESVYLRGNDGAVTRLWSFHEDKVEGVLYSIIGIDGETDVLLIGTAGRGAVLVSVMSIENELAKVHVVDNTTNTLKRMGGLGLPALVGLKMEVAQLLEATPRWDEKEQAIYNKLGQMKTSKIYAERQKAAEAAQAEREAKRAAKIKGLMEAPKVTAYRSDGTLSPELVKVESVSDGLLLPIGTQVLIMDGEVLRWKSVRENAGNKKYLANRENVTLEPPKFEGKAKILEQVYEEVNGELAEINLVASHQALVTLKATGLNGGAFAGYREEADDKTTVLKVFQLFGDKDLGAPVAVIPQ